MCSWTTSWQVDANFSFRNTQILGKQGSKTLFWTRKSHVSTTVPSFLPTPLSSPAVCTSLMFRRYVPGQILQWILPLAAASVGETRWDVAAKHHEFHVFGRSRRRWQRADSPRNAHARGGPCRALCKHRPAVAPVLAGAGPNIRCVRRDAVDVFGLALQGRCVARPLRPIAGWGGAAVGVARGGHYCHTPIRGMLWACTPALHAPSLLCHGAPNAAYGCTWVYDTEYLFLQTSLVRVFLGIGCACLSPGQYS